MRLLNLAATAAATLFLTPIALADDPAEGFGITPLEYPGQSATATLANGDIVSFDGLTVEHWSEDGIQFQVLTTLPSFVFPSFVILSPDETEIVFGESSAGSIYSLEFIPGAPTPVTQLNFNYDAVFEDADHILVSAAHLGFGNGNQIFRVQLSTGSTTQLAQLGGASGPLAINPQGDLYYATSSATFPVPAGSSEVLRWNASQLTGAALLSELDATTVQSGFDGAGSLAFAASTGTLFLAENNFGLGVNRVRSVPGTGPASILVEGTTGNTIGNLEWTASSGAAAYLPFQPASGGTLRYNTTDFFSLSQRNAVRPQRPLAAVSGAGTTGAGPFDVTLSGGPANGFAIVYHCLTSRAPAVEMALPFRFPLFLGLDLGTLAPVPGMIPIDSLGDASQGYVNPGGLEGLHSLQLLLFDASSKLVGSSNVTEL